MPNVVHSKPHEYVRKVRYINGITILFYTKESIYIKKGLNMFICQRWFVNRGTYANSWYKLYYNLYRSRRLKTLQDIRELANKFDIQMSPCLYGFPKIDSSVKRIVWRKRKEKK